MGEIFHSENFCAGEAGFAKRARAQFEHFLRSGDAARFAEGFDAAEDGGGGFAGDGLIGNGFEEGFVGRLVRFHFGLEGIARSDEFGEAFIAFSEILCCGVEIKGKCRRLVDQVRSPKSGLEDNAKWQGAKEKRRERTRTSERGRYNAHSNLRGF